jgi:hypothetical protein
VNLIAGALPQLNHVVGIIATEAGVNSGPGGWMPELRGILTVVIAVFTLMGSVYFIMLTNVGARLGFLLAFSAFAGWMFIMGAVWWAYGIGLKGPEPTWEAVTGRTILQDTKALHESGALDAPVQVGADAEPIEVAVTVEEQFVAEGWKQLDPSAAAFGQTSSQAEAYLLESGAFDAGGYRVVNVFDYGGERYPRFADGAIDFIAFWHKPRYAVVEVAPVLEQRTEPGRAPAVPVIDESRPHEYVYMIRNQGARREPAGFITVGSLIVFLICVWLLHTRDRRVTINRSQPALPAQA